MKYRIAIVGLGLLLALSRDAGAQTAAADSLELARKYTGWFYAGEADSLIARSTEQAKEGFSTIDRWSQYAESIQAQAGIELAIVEETWKPRNGACQYWRYAAFSGMEDLLLIRWVLTEDGYIAGFGLGPAEQAPPVDGETCPQEGPEKP